MVKDSADVRTALEALLAGAAFNFSRGKTRQLVAAAQKALQDPDAPASPATFYYNVQAGEMLKDRRAQRRAPKGTSH